MNCKNLWTRAALLVAMLPGAALATNHIVDIAWSAEGRFAHKAQIAAGGLVEVCGQVSVGEAVRWGFESTAPVDFNIHFHVGKEVVFPAKQPQVKTGRGTLRVELSQDHCWMWTNKGAGPVSLTVTLNR